MQRQKKAEEWVAKELKAGGLTAERELSVDFLALTARRDGHALIMFLTLVHLRR